MSDPKKPNKTSKSSSKTTASKPKASRATTRGLGRGLSALMSDVTPAVASDALIETEVARTSAVTEKTSSKNTVPVSASEEEDTGKRGVMSVSIAQLERNPDQPRRFFDADKLNELTESIRDKGVLQPILVRPLTRKINHAKKHYQIVAGERRWQAALKAGLDAMPVLVRELSDQDVLEIGVVENVQRADLNPIEEAMAYRALVDQFSRTQDDIAKAIGKSRSHIANMLRLLTLPKRAQEFLQQGKISTGHARAIISAPDPVALAEDIVEKNLSVREAEDWVRRLKKSADAPLVQKPIKDADTRKVESDLMAALGLAVDLKHKSPGGELKIKYTSSDQLDDLIKRLTI